MRKTCLNMVYELAQKDPRVAFIGSDLSPGLLSEMQQAYPERYYMEGIAEQAIIGMAAGMAMEGYLPYVNTIATFITRRCYEQVALDLCLHDLPVRLIGNGGGYVYAPLGPTHQAVEDIAIMRALPNMTVTAVCDAEEMKRLMNATLDWPHPIYIRLGKGGDPIVSEDSRGFCIGKAIDMMQDCQDHSDVLLISTGVISAKAVAAAKELQLKGIAARVLHLHTIKPFDHQTVVAAAEKTQAIVTVEEHSLLGGLGSATLECLADARMQSIPPIHRIGIPDCFAEHYGNQAALCNHYGINEEGILAAVDECRTRVHH